MSIYNIVCKHVLRDCVLCWFSVCLGLDVACPVLWVGGFLDASFEFYLREVWFQLKPDQHRKDIIQQESLGTDVLL